MKTLKIKHKGLFIDIPGMTSFRTPAILDVTKIDTELIRAELRKHGITTIKVYFQDGNEIITDTREPVKKERRLTLAEHVQNELGNILDTNMLEKIINEQRTNRNTTNRIEKLLLRFLENGIAFKSDQYDEPKKKKKFIEEEELDQFIPAINVENIQTKGNFISEKITQKTDLDNAKKLNENK